MMDISVELEAGEDILLEIGHFEDLMILVALLNSVDLGYSYRLEKVSGKKGAEKYLFIEDPAHGEDYMAGAVLKIEDRAYAISPIVHSLVIGAYERYVHEYGRVAEL